MSSTDFKLSILLPVRNEDLNLNIMLKMLEAIVEVPHEVLVVYDSLSDTSIPVIERMKKDNPNLRGIHNTLGRGVINAVKSGVKDATGDAILIFAADELGPLLVVSDMVALLRSGCDFVSCTRYAHGGRRLGGSMIGGVLSRLANFLFRHVTGSVLTDATTGIKMFWRKDFDRFELESKPVGWAVAFELAIKAQALNMHMGEVPIVSIDRLFGGESSFRLSSWFWEYLRWFRMGARLLKAKRQEKPRVTVRIPLAYSSDATGGPTPVENRR